MDGMVLMSKHTYFFGGWSLSPALLEGHFGQNCTYIDSNLIMPELFDKNNKLKDTWPQVVKKHLHLSDTQHYHLAGWSTGAMIALALASTLQVHSLTLISPTLSFCRREGHRHGTHPSVLRSMREQLQQLPRNVLQKFYLSCGFDETFKPVVSYTIEQLTLGLHFLEQVDLTKIVFACSNTIIIHGRNDAIIPYPAAEATAGFCSGTLHCIDAGHAVFYGRETELANYINSNNHTIEGNHS
jgi:pimeloyl-ACP methyl ester carboxylesterase